MPEDRRPAKFNRNPLLWLGIAFSVGILAAAIATVDVRIAIGSAGVVMVVAILLRSKAAATWLMLLAFVFAGLASAIAEKQVVAPDRIKILYDGGTIASGEPVEVEGVLIDPAESAVDGAQLNLSVDRIRHRGIERRTSGRVSLYLQTGDFKSEISDLKYGTRVRIATKLEREDEFLNPGVIPKREMLDRLGVDATGVVKSPLLIEKIADEGVFFPLAWVYDQRARIVEAFHQNLSGSAGGVMIASLLGNKQFLDKDTADLFRDGGTFHILVISGFHITFIGGLLLFALRRLTKRRWLQFAVVTGVLWAYTLAVGADVPVVRAALMFTVMMLGYAISRRGSLLNSFGFCGLILLVWRPSELFDPSFQLTFVSVGAIVAIAYPIVESLKKIGSWTPSRETPFPPNVPDRLRSFCEMLYWSGDRWKFEAARNIWKANLPKSAHLGDRIGDVLRAVLRYMFEGVLVSLIVQICMLPLSVVYFHRISVISILLNLWVGLFIAIESFAAVIGVLVGQFSDVAARGFYVIADAVNWLMLSLPRLFADNSWFSFRVPAFSGYGRGWYLLLAISIIALAVAFSRWNPFELGRKGHLGRNLALGSAAMLVLSIFVIVLHPFSAPRADGRLRIDFLDVGQGDSALVTFPDGRTLLVDGGGRRRYLEKDDEVERFERDRQGIGETVVSQFLWARGLSRLDFILATHADADHIQGLMDVARNFAIGSAIFGRMPPDDPDIMELGAVLQKRRIKTEIVAGGDAFTFGDVLVEVLAPPPAEPGAVSDNDSSVVIKLSFGGRSFLLTGDIEQRSERELVARSNLKADVVKVAHHGSRTSSTPEFVGSTAASIAVISVGRHSQFSHPHAEVVERWRHAGADVITTGERGTVTVTTNGTDLTASRYLPQ